MPTGYTCGVADGTITTFKEYALGCAKAFVWQCRDSDESLSTISASEASTYHKENIDRVQEQIRLLDASDKDQLKRMRDLEFDEALASYEKSEAERLAVKERYANMMAKARKYVPPTEAHKKFGEFLISQLEESTKWDDYEVTKPVRKPIREWIKGKKAGLFRDLAYHSKEYQKDIERTEYNNKWVKELIMSLEPKESKESNERDIDDDLFYELDSDREY